MNFYHSSASFLENLLQIIEEKDILSNLDTEYSEGVLKITINSNNKVFVINRNDGNQKIWYSSPFSGADYFSFVESTNSWVNSKNIELSKKLFDEINQFLT